MIVVIAFLVLLKVIWVLVEKLLRSCSEIKNIYLLIRPKRGQEVSARLSDLLNSSDRINCFFKKPLNFFQEGNKILNAQFYSYKLLDVINRIMDSTICMTFTNINMTWKSLLILVNAVPISIMSKLFDTMRKEKPKELTKVIPIAGDITSEQLGISESDQALLCKNVSIVFHSAATVKFDEKLKLSVTINMLGTKRLVELCHRMMSLDALIHVSTAYCNCDRTDVSEVIYAPPYNPYDVISLVNWLPEDLLDQLTPSLIGKRPNTYTFTKALAEHMLLKEAGNLPVAIVRPSIVIASLKEPFAGWVDNWNGPTGLVSALGQGLFRTILCEKNFTADMVPVDIVINLMIAAAWKVGTSKPESLLIYNCCTGQQHPITWGQFVEYAMRETRRHPLEGCLWYPTGVLRMNRSINKFYGFLVHYIPAYILDTMARLAGKKPIMVKVQDKIAKAVECLEYFTLHQWQFKDENVQTLIKLLDKKDREIFQFDVKKIEWDKYVERYVLGFREFLFKQRPESLPSSRKRMMRLYYMHQFTKLIIVLITWRFLMAHSKKARELWTRLMQMILQIIRLIPFF